MHEFNSENIYKRMLEIANADGIITTDEQHLIDNVKNNIDKYYRVLLNSYKDDIITAEEQNQLYEQRKSIMDGALHVAKSDEKVTQDEFTLLKAIGKILDEIEFHEHY